MCNNIFPNDVRSNALHVNCTMCTQFIDIPCSWRTELIVFIRTLRRIISSVSMPMCGVASL